MTETKEYRMVRITPETHRKLRILAAQTGESMITLIDRLATQEQDRMYQQEIKTMKYSRRQHIIEKIADIIVGRRLDEAAIDAANLAGWTLDIRFADGQYVSENNWSRVSDIHLEPDELAQAKRIAADLESTFKS